MSSLYQQKDSSRPTALILIILMLFSSIAVSMPQELPDSEESLSTSGRTGNETITIDPSVWHVAQGGTFYANISATGLSSTVSYQIEWVLCYECGMMGTSPYDNGSISVQSGVNSFYTPITINASGYNYNGSSEYTYLKVYLNSSGYLVDSESHNFAVGDDARTYINTYGGNSGNFLLGTDHPLLRVRGDNLDRQVTNGTNYTMDVEVEDSSGTTVYSNVSSMEANISNWNYNYAFENYINLSSVASPALQAGTYTIYANLTNNNLSHTKHFKANFTIVDLGLTGNEAVTIDPSVWHVAQGGTFYANISATGLSSTGSYQIEWILCYECGMMGTSPYDNGSITIQSGSTSSNSMITINATGYNYNGSSEYTYLKVYLNSSGYLVDSESHNFAVGDDARTYINTYGGNSGNFLLGTDHPLLRVRGDNLDRQVTNGTNYTMDVEVEDSSGTTVYSNVSSMEANISNWNYNYAFENYINLSSVASPALQAGTYTIYANLTNNNLSHTKHFKANFTMIQLGITDNSTLNLITEIGSPGDGFAWANFTFAEQDVDEWYTVAWNLTDSNGQEIDSDDFGWMAISNSYSKDVPFTNLDEGTYCVDATLYVGTDYVQATNQSCFTIELPDTDGDGVSDLDDWCANTPAGESVDVNGCAESQKDDDSDGVMNDVDLCPDTVQGSTVDAVGCSDDQLDDDGDGISNLGDLCPNTPAGETVDADGCSGSQLDDDGDGVSNDVDLCSETVTGATVDSDGCSQQQLLDSDNDGVNNQDDLCSNTPGNEVADSDGCSPSQLDSDGDGVSDADDQCPDTPTGATVDSDGCPSSTLDSDGDGVVDIDDLCPNTVQSATVDSDGCAESQLDDDADGVSNDVDLCVGTTAGDVVDTDGCSAQQLDPDNDGVLDSLDLCTGTPAGESVDADGCASSQLDSDADGITNDLDLCPATVAGEAVDTDGCSDNQRDSDSDGVVDSADACPNKAGTQTDGCPVNQAPTCDIFFSIKSQGMVIGGEAAISSVSGSTGIIPIPVGEYYIVALCSDPDGDSVNATITTPLGVHSESATSVKVGALVKVSEDMTDTIPIQLVWDDGKDNFQASFAVELGATPDPSNVGSGGFVPGFSLLTAISALCAVAFINRKD